MSEFFSILLDINKQKGYIASVQQLKCYMHSYAILIISISQAAKEAPGAKWGDEGKVT